MRVNVVKSKVMRCSRSADVSEISVLKKGELLEEDECLKFLGLRVAEGGCEETNVRFRVKEGKV